MHYCTRALLTDYRTDDTCAAVHVRHATTDRNTRALPTRGHARPRVHRADRRIGNLCAHRSLGYSTRARWPHVCTPAHVCTVYGRSGLNLRARAGRYTTSIDNVKVYKHSVFSDRSLLTPEVQEGSSLPKATHTGEGVRDTVVTGSDILVELESIISKIGSNPTTRKGPIPPDEQSSDAAILLNQVIEPTDQRADSEEFDKAKRKEVSGLEKRNTWRTVRKDSLPLRPNILGGQFVLSLKNVGTDCELPKARYVAQGHRVLDKPFMVHNITTLRQSSTRIIVSVAAIKSFRLFSHDMTQAYLQSDETLTRKVFLLPKRKDMGHFRISEKEIPQLLRPIYDMTDASDYWGVTVDNHAKNDLGLVPLLGDPSLYIKRNEEDVDGLLGMCVDDRCLAGNEKMQQLTKLTLKKFESRPHQWDNFEFFWDKGCFDWVGPIPDFSRDVHPNAKTITTGRILRAFQLIQGCSRLGGIQTTGCTLRY